MDEPILVELVDDQIVITSGFRDKDRVKLVPGVKWNADTRTWRVALSLPACHALRGIFTERLVIGPALTAWATKEVDTWINPARALSHATDVPGGGDPREYGFQRVGTEWLLTVRYGLLADEMGTGKTVQACCALNRLSDYIRASEPVLIVCPNSVKRVWFNHIVEWAPNLRPVVVGGGAAKRRKTLALIDDDETGEREADVAIVNWEALRLHSRLAAFGSIALSDKEKTPAELNRPWSVVIADEAHRAKGPASKQTRALWASSAVADYRWAFTGTPIANAPDDLWSILHFLYPAEWPAKSRYVDRYAMQSWSPFGGLHVVGLNPANEAELRKTLDVRMLRRTKAEVLPDLPDKVYETRFVELTPKERKAYDDLKKTLVAELDSGDQVVGWNPLTKTTRLLQLASSSLEVNEDESFKLCEPSSKLDELMELLDDLGDEPVVVAAASRQLIELLEARLEKAKITFGSVHGKIDPDQRQAYVDAFQAGHLRVMCLTVGAGGEGITLTRAATMIYLQRPWSMVQNSQSEDRIHRMGQLAEKITIIDLVAENTVEESVFSTLTEKEDRLEELVQDKARLRELLSTGASSAK